MVRRHAIVDGQAHPALLRHVRHQRRSPAAKRLPLHPGAARHKQQHRRGRGGQIPCGATRRATGWGWPRTGRRSGNTLRRCSRSLHSGGVRSGAGHSIARSLAGTMPRSAASVTECVLSRSCRRNSALPGLSNERAVARQSQASDGIPRRPSRWQHQVAQGVSRLRAARPTPHSWPACSRLDPHAATIGRGSRARVRVPGVRHCASVPRPSVCERQTFGSCLLTTRSRSM